MKRSFLLVGMLCLLAPFLLWGCSGDDGAQGPAGDNGAQGPPGLPGPPGTGVTAQETCVLCHAAGQTYDVNNMHRLNPSGSSAGERRSPGSATVTVTSVVFGAPVGDNVPVTVNFTFAAVNQAGQNVTSQIDLRTVSSGALSYLRFTLSKLVAGQNGDPNEWSVFVHRPGASGSGPYYENSPAGLTGDPATGVYSYAFPDNSVRVSDGYVDNAVMRLVVEARNLPITVFTSDPFYDTSTRRIVTDGILDSVPPVGGGTGLPLAPGDGYPRKDDVSTAACNACHDPLAIHGGSRRDYKYCVACHNAKLETAAGGGWDNSNLVNLVHKLHNHQMAGVQDIGELNTSNSFTEITYPQDIRNCMRCHQGTDADNTYDNWKNKPTITACGSCHITVNFATGQGHGPNNIGGPRPNNSVCSLCHLPADIVRYHATENFTPNNPTVEAGLALLRYEIASVAVDNNSPVVKFRILKDPTGTDNSGSYAPVVFNAYTGGDNNALKLAFVQRGLLTGFSGSPSFLVAYALPQDGVDSPADYNNLGKAAGQPASVSIAELQTGDGGSMTGPDASGFYTATLRQQVSRSSSSGAITSTVDGRFPSGAKLRAVALQGYFSQDVNNTPTSTSDDVGRHTFSAHKAVSSADERRVAVESGYVNGKPVGCLECHEIFEGHGGNRVSNAQVCVMCHNPNLSTSGRTITASPINSDIVEYFDNDGDPATVGTDPLTYPEVSNNFKELIHGLHGANKRTTDFVDIRNRSNGVIVRSDEITFPGDLSHCGKCHLNNLYQNIQTTGRLLTTAKTTTGNANETVAQINGARTSVPNATDQVNTPAASACGHCHDSVTARSHFVTMGGKVRAQRGTASAIPPPLEPVLGP